MSGPVVIENDDDYFIDKNPSLNPYLNKQVLNLTTRQEITLYAQKKLEMRSAGSEVKRKRDKASSFGSSARQGMKRKKERRILREGARAGERTGDRD